MEVWDPKPIGAGAKVRQLLHAPAGRTTRVDGAWLRVRRRDATGAAATCRHTLVPRIPRPYCLVARRDCSTASPPL
jgi:hypothetical protein